MSFIETYRGFVNTWECDENNHLNVQFYFKNFAEAAEIFAVRHDLDRIFASCPSVRHVRYLRELRCAASIAVKSAMISDGEFEGHIVHILENTDDQTVAATAIDACQNVPTGLPTVNSSDIAFALPRGIPSGVLPELPIKGLQSQNKAVPIKYGIVQPAQCNINGNLLSQQYIAQFSDGAAHIWSHMGVSEEYLSKNNFGRVALEMKLSVLEPIKVNAAIEVISHCHEMGDKAFTIRHQICDAASGKAYATAQVINLIMDLEKRKAVAVPDFVRSKFS